LSITLNGNSSQSYGASRVIITTW